MQAFAKLSPGMKAFTLQATMAVGIFFVWKNSAGTAPAADQLRAKMLRATNPIIKN